MKQKYRIKLKSGRVVGPFIAAQIGELYLKGHIDGTENCQSFPVGDWGSLNSFNELVEILAAVAADAESFEKSKDEKTNTVAILSSAKKARDEKAKKDEANKIPEETFQEFKFGRKAQVDVDYNELEKKYAEKRERERLEEEANPPGIEATRIIKRPSAEQEIDKTRIVNPNPFKGQVITQEKSEEEEGKSEEGPSNEAEPTPMEEEKDYSDEKTAFIDLDDALPRIRAESKIAEREMSKQIALIDNEFEQDDSENETLEEETEEETPAKKRGMKPIVAFAFLALFVVILFPDEPKDKPIKPNYPRIEFPVANEFIDEVKSTEAFRLGVEASKKNTYMSNLEASGHFRESLTFRFRNNDSLGHLILAYAKILENARDRGKAANTLFRLLQIAKSKQLTDVNVAMGSALFYSKMGKHYTALNIIENFVRVNTPTAELYGIYLDVAISAGRLDVASKIAGQLEVQGQKPLNVYLSLIRFHEFNQRYEKAKEIITEASNYYSTSVPLLLRFASLSLNLNDIDHFKKVLSAVKLLEAENSPVYYAKYLEYQGMLFASEGNVEEASRLFREALDIQESDELRSKLAQLEAGGDELVSNLILESKAIEKMNQAREEMRARNWDRALTRAIEGADILPNYIPAQLLLTDIQTRRGYFEHALNNLERLKQIYPVNDKINYYLVITFIRSYRVDDAEREIVVLSQTDFAKTPEYAAALGEFYDSTGNVTLAVRNYIEAIKRNPLEDKYYYAMAQIFLKHRKYTESRDNISKAIELDPMNIYYHSLYAKILYELEGSDVAIGYLRNILEDSPDNPRVLGDIAIYYFRAGRIKEFEEYRDRLEGLRVRDESFYEFLVEASRLRGNDENVIRYSKELIRVNPGDLSSRMSLGNFLIKLGRNEEAIKEFRQITERLSNYPRANYSIAKASIALKRYDDAIEYAQKEIEGNPEIYHGYYVMGEALRQKEEFQESLKFLEKAVSINGRSVETLIALGWIYYRQNFLEKARELYLRAQREDPSVPEVHKQLGYIYRSSGQGRLAAESFNTYLQLVPNASDRNQIEAMIRHAR